MNEMVQCTVPGYVQRLNLCTFDRPITALSVVMLQQKLVVVVVQQHNSNCSLHNCETQNRCRQVGGGWGGGGADRKGSHYYY